MSDDSRSFEEMFMGGELHVSDFLFVLRETAGHGADELKVAIDKATALYERLNSIADKSEDSAQLVASSNIEPESHALPPLGSGLTFGDPSGLYSPEAVERFEKGHFGE